MNNFFLSIALLIAATNLNAQSEKHKIVFDLNSKDTSVHSTVLRQFTNILKAAPDAELELVCHGQAVFMFVSDKFYLEEKVKELKAIGNVSFKICANSMKRYNVDKSQINPLGDIVPIAMLEISSKEKEGWSYIKAGN